MRATEQYFPQTLFYYALNAVALTFETVDEILKCYPDSNSSDESYLAVLSCGGI